MKKITQSLLTISLLLFSLTFISSCDDDTMDALELDGSWEGKFGMQFQGRFADVTWITFIKDRDRSGYGYQRDFYSGGIIIDYDIRWRVNNGTLYISYYDLNGLPYENLETVITGYRLDSQHFYGNVGNLAFKLYKIADWH